MGFLTPKMSVPATPVAPAPDPAPSVEQIEQETFDEVGAKQRRRKGLESTLLSQKEREDTLSGSTPQPPAGGPTPYATRKTLG